MKIPDRLDGAVDWKDSPPLASLPTATCPLCGAIYGALWSWVGTSVKAGGHWELRRAAQLMDGYPGYLGHKHFCAQATPEQRAVAGKN